MATRGSITRRFVNDALRRHAVWDLGNEALYRLCRRHPGHRRQDEIAAKVWLIGRSYAASIERRRSDVIDDSGDDFYVDLVAPTMRGARIDRWLAPVGQLKQPDAAVVVPVHKRLTDLFAKISGQEKRSLASKYLHFHFPKAVYIFDDRARRAICEVTSPLPRRAVLPEERDEPYARFCLRCEQFHDELEARMGRRMTPREVDKVLLAVAERQ